MKNKKFTNKFIHFFLDKGYSLQLYNGFNYLIGKEVTKGVYVNLCYYYNEASRPLLMIMNIVGNNEETPKNIVSETNKDIYKMEKMIRRHKWEDNK